MLSEVTVNQHTGEITFDGITTSVRDVKIDIKEEKKCKILTITYNNQEYVLKSAPRSLLFGQDKIADKIDEIEKQLHNADMSAYIAELHKEQEEKDKKEAAKGVAYGFLIKSLHPLQEAITAGFVTKPFNPRTSQLFAMPCGIRGQRLFIIKHPDKDIQKQSCDFVRNLFGDKIVQEGELAECDINHEERNMDGWKFK